MTRALLALLLTWLAAWPAPARAQDPAPPEAPPSAAAGADTLAQIVARGRLIWGADQEGGGPFVYPDDNNPDQMVGFEVDLAAKLAEYLGVQPEFAQGQWDLLLSMLETNKVDLVLNGYEWSEARADGFDATMPYYVYGLQMLVRTSDTTLSTWDDLKKPKADGSPVRIGVLTGSAAEEITLEHCGANLDSPPACEVVSYDGNTEAMREVEVGKLDATLADTPIASFYLPQFPELRNLEGPVSPGYYVIYVRKGNPELVAALNEAIILMIRNGDLERIYRKYGIWDDQQRELVALADTAKHFGYFKATVAAVDQGELLTQQEVAETTTRERGVVVFKRYFGTLVGASAMTVVLAVISFPLAILIGLSVAVGRLYGPGWLRLPLTAYVEFLRGTPLMLQLYFLYFLLPEVGINLPALPTAILGLAVNYSAYESEIYRAGLQAIPEGQLEAALSLGMSRGQAIRRIIVPQAVRIVIPPVVNDFIALFKDTSVCSVVTIVELTKQFSVLSRSTQAIVEMMLMTCALYLLMSYPLSLISRRLEKRLGNGVNV